jgi:hypothetical protein
VEQRELSLVASRNEWSSHFERQLAVVYRTKGSFIVQFKCVENLCPYKNLKMAVYSSFVHNYQNLEETKCLSIGKWMNELWYIKTWNVVHYSKE